MNQSNRQSNHFDLEQVDFCSICGSRRLQRKFAVYHITGDPQHNCATELGFSSAIVASCLECGFMFKTLRPSVAYLQKYYSGSGEGYLESLAEDQPKIREDFRAARSLLRKVFPTGGKILDIGCASGFFLESLGDTWRRSGVELFHFAAEQARRRGGVFVHEGDLISAKFEPQSFDAVCSFDVLEHLPDPMPMLREARRILRQGGSLVLGTANSRSITARLSGSRWTYVCIPEHISFFNPNSLKTGLRSAGFSEFTFKRIHHGERSRLTAVGWIRAVGKNWAIEYFGKDIVRLGLFRQKTSEFLVPYYFDHMLCLAR